MTELHIAIYKNEEGTLKVDYTFESINSTTALYAILAIIRPFQDLEREEIAKKLFTLLPRTDELVNDMGITGSETIQA